MTTGQFLAPVHLTPSSLHPWVCDPGLANGRTKREPQGNGVCLELNLNVVAAPAGHCSVGSNSSDLQVPALTLLSPWFQSRSPGTCTSFLNLHQQPSSAPNKILSCLGSQELVLWLATKSPNTPLPQAVMRITWDDAKGLSVHRLVTQCAAIWTMCPSLRSKLYPCDLRDCHNQGWLRQKM